MRYALFSEISIFLKSLLQNPSNPDKTSESDNKGRLLTTLKLGHNKLSGRIPRELADLSNLAHVLLNNNEFIGELHADLGKLTSVDLLSVQNNRLSGKVPEDLDKASSKALEFLYGNNKGSSGKLTAPLRENPIKDDMAGETLRLP